MALFGLHFRASGPISSLKSGCGWAGGVTRSTQNFVFGHFKIHNEIDIEIQPKFYPEFHFGIHIKIQFRIYFQDDKGGNPDENVTGTTQSNVQHLRASGSNVSLPAPPYTNQATLQ